MMEMDKQKEQTKKSVSKKENEAHEKPAQKKAVDDTRREEVQDKGYAQRIEEKTEKH